MGWFLCICCVFVGFWLIVLFDFAGLVCVGVVVLGFDLRLLVGWILVFAGVGGLICIFILCW